MSVKIFHKTKAMLESLYDSQHFKIQRLTLSASHMVVIQFDGGDHKESTYNGLYVASGAIEVLVGESKYIVNKGEFLSGKFYIDYTIRFHKNSEIFICGVDKVNDSVNPTYQKFEDMTKTIEKYDNYTLEHSERVGYYTLIMLGILKYKHIDIGDVAIAARYHDIGKIKIDASILNKPGKLTDKEYELMKQHPIYSYEILKPLIGEQSAQIALHHHERLDGSGYPNHLTAKDLNIPDRIIAVCDIFDAISSTRPYHRERTIDETFKIMRTEEKDKIDQTYVNLLERLIRCNLIFVPTNQDNRLQNMQTDEQKNKYNIGGIMQKDDIEIYETNDISDEILYIDKIELTKGQTKEIVAEEKNFTSEPDIYIVSKGKISIMNDTLVNGEGFSIDNDKVEIIALENSHIIKVNVRPKFS